MPPSVPVMMTLLAGVVAWILRPALGRG